MALPKLTRSDNDDLIDVRVKALDIPKRSVEIVSGERSRSKRVRISGYNRDRTLTALGAAEEPQIKADKVRPQINTDRNS